MRSKAIRGPFFSPGSHRHDLQLISPVVCFHYVVFTSHYKSPCRVTNRVYADRPWQIARDANLADTPRRGTKQRAPSRYDPRREGRTARIHGILWSLVGRGVHRRCRIFRWPGQIHRWLMAVVRDQRAFGRPWHRIARIRLAARLWNVKNNAPERILRLDIRVR